MTIKEDYTFSYQKLGDISVPLATHNETGRCYAKGCLMSELLFATMDMVGFRSAGPPEKYREAIKTYMKFNRLLRRLKKMEK